ncbi:hypothetical protein IWX49DRAFT_199380 [Phyllosticta citricarpa]|uniref:Uncharacterized protein n=1 Tax=Phyllosticta citricarpa TaxID=55181 RepID=A0ABR1LZX1_9PEZI
MTGRPKINVRGETRCGLTGRSTSAFLVHETGNRTENSGQPTTNHCRPDSSLLIEDFSRQDLGLRHIGRQSLLSSTRNRIIKWLALSSSSAACTARLMLCSHQTSSGGLRRLGDPRAPPVVGRSLFSLPTSNSMPADITITARPRPDPAAGVREASTAERAPSLAFLTAALPPCSLLACLSWGSRRAASKNNALSLGSSCATCSQSPGNGAANRFSN